MSKFAKGQRVAHKYDNTRWGTILDFYGRYRAPLVQWDHQRFPVLTSPEILRRMTELELLAHEAVTMTDDNEAPNV